MLRSLRGFVPWIAYGIVSEWNWPIACVVGFVLTITLLVDGLRTEHTLDEAVIELSSSVFFLVLTAVALFAPDSPVQHQTGPLSFGWLALTAWGSMAIGHPFTLGIARRQVPERMWKSEQFYHVNVVITSVWAGSLTAALVAELAVEFLHATGVVATIAINVIVFVIPFVFTLRYSKYKQRQAAEFQAQQHAQHQPYWPQPDQNQNAIR